MVHIKLEENLLLLIFAVIMTILIIIIKWRRSSRFLEGDESSKLPFVVSEYGRIFLSTQLPYPDFIPLLKIIRKEMIEIPEDEYFGEGFNPEYFVTRYYIQDFLRRCDQYSRDRIADDKRAESLIREYLTIKHRLNRV